MNKNWLFTALLPLAGCATEPSQDIDSSDSPSAKYCLSVGGDLGVRQGSDGPAEYCRMPDGSVYEEWDLPR